MNLQNAMSFRLDKRPGVSHLALDGKKNVPAQESKRWSFGRFSAGETQIWPEDLRVVVAVAAFCFFSFFCLCFHNVPQL